MLWCVCLVLVVLTCRRSNLQLQLWVRVASSPLFVSDAPLEPGPWSPSRGCQVQIRPLHPSPAPSNAQLLTSPRVRNSTSLQPADAARSGRINPSSAHRVLASIAFVPRAQFPNRLLIAPAFSSQRPGGTWAHGDYPRRAIGQMLNCSLNCRFSIGCFIKAFHKLPACVTRGFYPTDAPRGKWEAPSGYPWVEPDSKYIPRLPCLP